ncbi:MAG: diguanylate cyclase, partial [Clostridiaceae bacterium]|nr:diguanylate cyclase [Clostridiaceae bacterium]
MKKIRLKVFNKDSLTVCQNITQLKDISDKIKKLKNINAYYMANLVVSNLNDIREVFGYIEANKVQEEVNYILKRNTYKDELLFKACNDDFVMMLKFSAKTETVSRMNKIINEVNDRYDMKKSEYPVILSIGLYVSKSEDSNMDAMMQKSLQARRHIKERDITRFMFFEETMNIITIEENLLQQEFVNSIEKDDFLIYIQPKVSLKDNSICGGEILSRWYNPRRGL